MLLASIVPTSPASSKTSVRSPDSSSSLFLFETEPVSTEDATIMVSAIVGTTNGMLSVNDATVKLGTATIRVRTSESLRSCIFSVGYICFSSGHDRNSPVAIVNRLDSNRKVVFG